MYLRNHTTNMDASLLAAIKRDDSITLLSALGEDFNVNARDDRDKSLLDVAVLLGKPTVIKALVQRGASVNDRNKSGYAALHWCAAWDQLDCLKELVSLGASHDVKTRNGETARDLAARYNHRESAAYLDCVAARTSFSLAVKAMRDILADTERIQGKWNKEDKSKVTAACNEKADWLEKTKDAAVVEIQDQKVDFCHRMEPYLAKLPPGVTL